MDLKLLPAEASPEERAAVASVFDSSSEASNADRVAREGLNEAKARRHLLLPALHAVQKAVGWISQGALNEICCRLIVPPAEAYGVASFYAMFSTVARAPRVAHVCDDIACKLAGADAICATLERTIGPPGTSSADGQATWLRSPCLGLCERSPAALFQLAGSESADDDTIAPATIDEIEQILNGATVPAPAVGSTPQTSGTREPELRLLRRVGVADPTSLSAYRAAGGYDALARAVQMGPAQVIAEVSASELQGRGGAAFPTGRKWDAVAKTAETPRYVVCNADESEPGTFKDRVLMEEDPFATVESMTVAGFAVSAAHGYLYVRGEYPLATARLEGAIRQCRADGLLGADVMGKGFAFDIELRRGAGAYICGEESAMIESIEGKRGLPRHRPPYVAKVGLFSRPTLVHNVETLFWVREILHNGEAWYRDNGRHEHSGLRAFSVSGRVKEPGVKIAPAGITVRELIDEFAGGMADGHTFKAYLPGGASGGILPASLGDTPLDFGTLEEHSCLIGSAAVIVLSDRDSARDAALNLMRFFENESCGQCTPCRAGCEKLSLMLESGDWDDDLIRGLSDAMREASICGLGQAASNPVISALNFFRGEVS